MLLRNMNGVFNSLLKGTVIIVTLGLNVCVGQAAELLKMTTASSEQVEILRATLGDQFVTGKGAFPPKLLVAQPKLSDGGERNLIAVQKGLCSNHSCTFFVLTFENGKWQKIGAIDSWGIPYLQSQGGKPADLIGFDHLTNDCMACSPPRPVLFQLRADASKREYSSRGELKGSSLKPQWWQ